MFEEGEKLNIPAGSKKQDAKNLGITIRVMPEEFRKRPVAQQVVSPSVKPAEVGVSPVPPKPSPVTPKPATVPAPRKNKKGALTFVLLGVFILLFTAVGVGAYFYFFTDLLRSQPEVVDNVDEPEPDSASEVEEPVPEPVVTTPVPGKDTDSDGITDREEMLYGTDFRNPDTDGDTFLDGNEVFHRYDPLGYAPSTLLDTGSVDRYIDPEKVFELTYPKAWSVTSVGGVIRFKTSTAAVVSITPQLLEAMDLAEWLQTRYPNERLLPETITKEGYLAVFAEENRMAFVTEGDRVYMFEYALNGDTLIDFLQTFQMMVNSFKVIEETTALEEVPEEESNEL